MKRKLTKETQTLISQCNDLHELCIEYLYNKPEFSALWREWVVGENGSMGALLELHLTGLMHISQAMTTELLQPEYNTTN